MNLSKTKIAVFFTAVLILGWFLYPRELFLAFIYEGGASLDKSEAHYKTYLQKKPFNKFATLRLVHVYERMGKPGKGTPLLCDLYDHRPGDWKVASIYLDHLENIQDDEALYLAVRKIVDNFLKIKNFPRQKLVHLLQASLDYVQWKQRTDEAYDILLLLARLSKNPEDYLETMAGLDLGLKKTGKIILNLSKKLRQNPKDVDVRQDLASVYAVNGNDAMAFQLIDDGISLEPGNLALHRLRIYLDEKKGDIVQQRDDLLKIIALAGMDDRERLNWMTQLAGVHQKLDHIDESLKLFRTILNQDKKNPVAWKNLVYALTDFHKTDEAISLLRDYRTYFPDDVEQEKQLVSLLLYEKKDASELDAYIRFIKKSSLLSYALDVGYLLSDLNLTDQTISWLHSVLSLFPGNSKLNDLLIDTYIKAKEYENALKFALQLLKGAPQNGALIFKIAQIYTFLFDNQSAVHYLEELAVLKAHDYETQKVVGRELFFMGKTEKAISYWHNASRIKIDDPELWFWLSEGYWTQGEKGRAKSAAVKFKSLIPPEKKISLELARMLLRSRGHLEFGPRLIEQYEKEIEKNKASFELAGDFIDLLLEKKRTNRAREELKLLEKTFPNQKENYAYFKIRLEMLDKNWDKALSLINPLIHKQPNNRLLQRDLAEIYSKKGKWKKAIKTYENIFNATGNEYKIKGPLQELHQIYDHRITSSFSFTDLGSDELIVGTTGYRGFLNDTLELKGEFSVGNFKSPSINFDNSAEFGKISLKKYFMKNWTLEGGGGFGVSDRRKTLSPFAAFSYKPLDYLSLTLKYNYRNLRVDLPQALSAGALWDIGELTFNYQPLPRLIFSSRYELSRSYLPAGDRGIENTVEPSLTYIVIQKPSVSVGYQYRLAHVSDSGNFLNEVPLIPDVRTHYFSGTVDHRFDDALTIHSGFYVGEDTERNLHLFEGDLFGFTAYFVWNVSDWLDMDARYDYGKETRTSITGQSHVVNFGLSGHWR